MASTNVQDQIFTKLKISLEGQKAQAAFCCGGSSKIKDRLSMPDVGFNQAPPVIVHYARETETDVKRIVFAQNRSTTRHFKKEVQALVDTCQPASFGRGSVDVMDGERTLWRGLSSGVPSSATERIEKRSS